MRADNSHHIVEAARRRSEYTRAKAIQAIRSLDAAGQPVTFEVVANRAGVSRSWLYAQPDLRAEVERLRATHRRAPASPVPERQRSSDASLLRRLEAADNRIRRLTEDNKRLREQLALALGEHRATSRARPPRPGAGDSKSVTIGPC